MIRHYDLHPSDNKPYCMFRIGALQRFTLLDYPGKVACIIFTQGCNFRCPYCYNVELVLPKYFKEPLDVQEVYRFLNSRVGLLEGLVITGGEPTVQGGLEEFIKDVKELGFSVKLDTNGSKPDVIKSLLDKNLLDYVAMDVKAPLEKYPKVVRVEVDVKDIEESIRLIMESGVDYEFRTTVVKELLSPEDLLEIGNLIRSAKKYYIQRFLPTNTLDPSFAKATTYTDEELERVLERLKEYVELCAIR